MGISRCLLVLLFYFSLCQSFGQIKDIGLPFIDNYTREAYQAGTQNWAIDQDNEGLMYFANNEGLLRFDGRNWRLYPLPNRSIVRSVKWIDGKLFAGGYEEFGYFSYDDYGSFEYVSLSDSLESIDKAFDEIWRIFETDHGIVFQSFLRLFIYKNGRIHSLSPRTRYGFSYFVDNNLFVVDRGEGLGIMTANGIFPIYRDTLFFRENEITFILGIHQEKYLVGTTSNGIYLFDGNELSPWDVEINEVFTRKQIYTGLKLNPTQIAIGTIQDGVYVLDLDGSIVIHLDRARGLQNNTVLSMFLDRYSNLWLGMDNGIDVLEISSPISRLHYAHGIETAYVSLVHDDILYVGTNQGLFARKFTELSNESLEGELFTEVEGIAGQVWSLGVFRGKLICGANFGTYVVEAYAATQISDRQGGWAYVEIPGRSDKLLAGTYTGLQLFSYSDANPLGWIEDSNLENFNESSKSILFDEENRLWMTHNYKGLYRLGLSDDYLAVDSVRIYNESRGLPGMPYNLSKIEGRMYVVTGEGLFRYNDGRDSFYRDEQYDQWLKDEEGLTRIIEDQAGDLWYFNAENLGVLRRQEDGTYYKMIKPFRRIAGKFLGSSFENVYSYNPGNVFIGAERGILHYNPDKEKNFDPDYNTYIDHLVLKGRQQDSLILHRNELGKDYLIPYRLNSPAFHFFAPFFENRGKLVYSFRLEGFDPDWSDWQESGYKEYTNLREGEYSFYVRARNANGHQSNVASVNLTISPPFFRTKGAYILYFFFIVIMVGLLMLFVRRRIGKAREIEKAKHAKELESREASYQEGVKLSKQEIERLKNEQLVLEMRHKTMELANSTMYLVQKNKFLNRTKSEINDIIGNLEKESNKQALRQIVHRIDRDIKSKQYWRLFDQYFDEVHEDFLNRLKQMHPDLTPKDLRLCAYLKMNISTKEIAPLMNISVRGVEISRYRLRKKLGLESGSNLTEYILSI